MEYKNAHLVLPDNLVIELQKYLQGEYLYVPSPKESRKGWGERSGYRKEIDKRNQKIMQEYRSGLSIEEIADNHFLSIHSIRKIIYQK